MVQFHELVPKILVLDEPLNKARSRVAEICLQLHVELLDELPGFRVGLAERVAGDFKDSRSAWPDGEPGGSRSRARGAPSCVKLVAGDSPVLSRAVLQLPVRARLFTLPRDLPRPCATS